MVVLLIISTQHSSFSVPSGRIRQYTCSTQIQQAYKAVGATVWFTAHSINIHTDSVPSRSEIDIESKKIHSLCRKYWNKRKFVVGWLRQGNKLHSGCDCSVSLSVTTNWVKNGSLTPTGSFSMLDVFLGPGLRGVLPFLSATNRGLLLLLGIWRVKHLNNPHSWLASWWFMVVNNGRCSSLAFLHFYTIWLLFF